MRAAIYARVSTNNRQTAESQLIKLRDVASKAGWAVVEEFVDEGISGAKSCDKRPAFDALSKAVTPGKADIVMAWSVDRLGRSLQDLVSFFGELEAAGVNLYLDGQGIDTTTPVGRAMFQMAGVFAEFERSMIGERVKAGLARARASGKKLGRRRVSNKVERQILEKRREGKWIRKIASELGVGVSVVQRVTNAKESEGAVTVMSSDSS